MDDPAPEPFTIGLAHELVRLAASFRDVEVADILGSSRKGELIELRFAIIWTLRTINPRLYTWMAIARRLGYEDHTSVIHGFHRARARRDNEYTFRKLTDRLLAFAESRAPYLKTSDISEAAA